MVTFGGGIEKYRRSARMLANDACDCGWFDRIVLFTDKAARPNGLNQKISHRTPEWAERDLAFITNHRRGFGYWLWKPMLVSSTLASMDEGEVLLYADGGCEFSRLGTQRFFDYVEIADRNGALFFRIPGRENAYTKRELLEYLGTTKEEEISSQCQGGIFLLKNCAKVRDLINEWLRLCREDDMRLLTDEKDPSKQGQYFVDHRHDQSILSILVKRSSFAVIDSEDQFDKRLYNIVNSWVLLLPFHTRRARDFRKTPLLVRISTGAGCRKSLRSSLFFRIQFAIQTILTLSLDFNGIRPMARTCVS